MQPFGQFIHLFLFSSFTLDFFALYVFHLFLQQREILENIALHHPVAM